MLYESESSGRECSCQNTDPSITLIIIHLRGKKVRYIVDFSKAFRDS